MEAFSLHPRRRLHTGTADGARKGWSDERRAKQRAQQQALWADPERKKEHSQRAKEATAKLTPEQRSERVRKGHQKPGRQEKFAESMGEAWADPKRKEEWLASLREPEMNKRRGAKVSAYAATPEGQAKLSAASKEHWADPEAKARHIAGMIGMDRSDTAHKTPGFRAKASVKTKEQMAALTEDERRALMVPARSKKAQLLAPDVDPAKVKLGTPEERERRSARAKARFAAMTEDERRAYTARARRGLQRNVVTRIELAVLHELNQLKIPYFVHPDDIGYNTPDVHVPSANLIIECDGTWRHNQPGAAEFDAKIDAERQALGYRTLRLPEAEIKDGSFKERLRTEL